VQLVHVVALLHVAHPAGQVYGQVVTTVPFKLWQALAETPVGEKHRVLVVDLQNEQPEIA